jgi:hypothetical protein
MLKRLSAALRAFRSAGRDLPAPETLEGVAGRVAALEDIQVRRELEWAETKSALDRMLKRFAALDQRAREREEPANGRRSRDQLREVMRAKGLLKGE